MKGAGGKPHVALAEAGCGALHQVDDLRRKDAGLPVESFLYPDIAAQADAAVQCHHGIAEAPHQRAVGRVPLGSNEDGKNLDRR